MKSKKYMLDGMFEKHNLIYLLGGLVVIAVYLYYTNTDTYKAAMSASNVSTEKNFLGLPSRSSRREQHAKALRSAVANS
jgi:hypothetical protein